MPYARSSLIVLALLANTVHAGALEDDPRWKTCMENGGTLRSCAPQVLGADAPVATLGTPRTFTPGGGLTAAQENRVNQLIGGHGTVVSAYNTANSALWYGQDARSRAISAQSTANNAQSTANDGRSRAISAQARADYAYSKTAHATWPAWYYVNTNSNTCMSDYCPPVCAPGYNWNGGGLCSRQ